MIQYTFFVLLFLLCAGSGAIYLLPCAVSIQQPISRNIAYHGGVAHANSIVALDLRGDYGERTFVQIDKTRGIELDML